MSIKTYISGLKSDYLKYKRSEFFSGLSPLIDASPSIISNNCLAGRIYQDFGLPYSSPTAGLYFFFPDYIEFLKDFETNIKRNLTFVSQSKYDLGNERIANSKHKYPIALLDGKFEIHFLHYQTQYEAESKWYRRCERLNLKNIIVLGSQLDLCTEKDIVDFDNLLFERKFFFSCKPNNLKSSIFIKEFAGQNSVSDPYQKGHLYYKYLAATIMPYYE